MRPILRLALFVAVLAVPGAAWAQSGPYSFYALTPCRIVDTRNPDATNGGPALGEAVTRSFAIRGNCGVPADAKAVAINVAITQPTTQSHLIVWPSDQTRPVASSINFDQNDFARANGVIVGVSTLAQDLSVYNRWGTVHVIIDVTGFFK